MGALKNKKDRYHLSGASGSIVGGSEVILDVTGGDVFLGQSAGLELVEDGGHGLTEHIGQDIETTTVGHTDDAILDTYRGREI